MQSQHQWLPSFRDIIPAHLHEAIESTQSGLHSPTSTYTNVQAPCEDNRSNATSLFPNHPSAVLTFTEDMEEYSYQAQLYSSFQHAEALPSIQDPKPTSHKIPDGMDTDRSLGTSSYPPIPGYEQPSANWIDPQTFALNSSQSHQALRCNGNNIGYQARYQSRYNPHRSHSSYAPYKENQTATIPPPSSVNMVGDNDDSRGKRRRGNLPKPATRVLRAWLVRHLDKPYPNEEEKRQFILRTGLTLNQISNWFINARRRQLPSLLLRKQSM